MSQQLAETENVVLLFLEFVQKPSEICLEKDSLNGIYFKTEAFSKD